MLSAIIYSCICMTHNSHRYFSYRANGLPAIGNLKSYMGKVYIGIGKILSCQAHSRSTYHLSYSCIDSTESKIVFSIERIADGYIIASHSMLNPIIYCCIRMTDNSHHDLSYRSNGLPTVRHHKGHMSKVDIDIGKLLSNQAHIGGTYHHSYRGINPAECKIIFSIKRIVDSYFITTHQMLCAIIYRRINMTGNSHRHLGYRSNSLPTVGHVKNNCSKVFVGVGKLLGSQSHIGSTHKYSYCRICSIKTIVTIYIIETIIGRGFITDHTMLHTIIYGGVAMTRNSHRHFSNRIDGLPAIGHVKDNSGKIFVNIGKLIYRQSHISSTHISSCCRICSTKTIVTIQTIETIACRCLIANHTMLSTVIYNSISMTGNSHRHFRNWSYRLPTINHIEDN